MRIQVTCPSLRKVTGCPLSSVFGRLVRSLSSLWQKRAFLALCRAALSLRSVQDLQQALRAARDGRRHQTLDQETDPHVFGGTGAVHFYCLESSSYFLHKNLLYVPLGAQQCCSAQVLKLFDLRRNRKIHPHFLSLLGCHGEVKGFAYLIDRIRLLRS